MLMFEDLDPAMPEAMLFILLNESIHSGLGLKVYLPEIKVIWSTASSLSPGKQRLPGDSVVSRPLPPQPMLAFPSVHSHS